MKTFEEIALSRFPEQWENEPYSHAIQPKQYDINKSERLAFIEGLEYMYSLLKDNLSISADCENILDYGNQYTSVTIRLWFADEKMSETQFTL